MVTSILDQLACSLGQRDESSNIALAVRLIKLGSPDKIKELMLLLDHKKSEVRSDAIKVVYEIADRQPELIIGSLKELIRLLDHKDNRLRWGAMSGLSALSKYKPEALTSYIVRIVEAMEEGSVITRDHGIYILTHIAGLKKYHTSAVELLLEQLQTAPVNQFAMYAEKVSGIISRPFVPGFRKILLERTDVAEFPAKAKRIEKVQRDLDERFKA